MPAIEQFSRMRSRRPHQIGVAAVEFALLAFVFFALFFGIVEIARAMYVINTLQEVTRRAAAFASRADFSNEERMQAVRENAIFRNSPGVLLFAQPVADTHIVIDYLWIRRSGGVLAMLPISPGSMPASPAANFANCLGDPYSERCIRLVRVRVCASAGPDQCEPVGYQPLVSLLPFSFGLPAAVTIVAAETLGMPAGVPTCEC